MQDSGITFVKVVIFIINLNEFQPLCKAKTTQPGALYAIYKTRIDFIILPFAK